jgi:poly-gamma-glutamate capsule biosynthesis protein CapA/YwtB (metallophosphatase superfamily)
VSAVVFVGDIRIGSPSPASKLGYEVLSSLLGAQSLIGNIEIPICAEQYGAPAEKTVPFRASESVALALAESGFIAGSVANNHATSWGIDGLLRTTQVLRDAGITPIGGGLGWEEAIAPWRSPDGKSAVLALSTTVDMDCLADQHRAGVAGLRVRATRVFDPRRAVEMPQASPNVDFSFSESGVRRVCEAIETLRRTVPYVAVMIHWGPLFSSFVDDWQFQLAERLALAGAQLIVGCHSHTVGPVARFHDTLVCFGIGNWLWSPELMRATSARHPGQARKILQWCRPSLALSVSDTSTGDKRRIRLVALEFSLELGGVRSPMAERDTSLLAGFIEWLSISSCRERPGWQAVNLFDAEPWTLPVGYGADVLFEPQASRP